LSCPHCVFQERPRLSAFWAAVAEDIRVFQNMSPENRAAGDSAHERLSAFLSPDVFPVFWYRVAHFCYAKGWSRTAVLVSRLNYFVHKCTITPQSCIGPGCRLPHPAGVVFHGRAGRNLTLYSLAVCVPRGDRMEGPPELGPKLGDNVAVGGHSVLLGPIEIPGGTKIGHCVRLACDVPANCYVVSAAMRQPRSPVSAGPEVFPP
jgi:serine O-acetyltransferase